MNQRFLPVVLVRSRRFCNSDKYVNPRIHRMTPAAHRAFSRLKLNSRVPGHVMKQSIPSFENAKLPRSLVLRKNTHYNFRCKSKVSSCLRVFRDFFLVRLRHSATSKRALPVSLLSPSYWLVLSRLLTTMRFSVFGRPAEISTSIYDHCNTQISRKPTFTSVDLRNYKFQ